MSRLRLTLVLAAASSLVLAPAGARAALPAGPVNLGAAFSLTGSASLYGVAQTRAAQLAVDQVNASGALAPATLNLISRDDGSSADRASAIFGEIGQPQLNDQSTSAVALLGPTLSTAALAADKVAQDQGTPVLGVSNTVDGIVEIGNFVFRNSVPESAAVPQTVKAVLAKRHVKRPAMIWARPDTYSRGAATTFRNAFQKAGRPLVVERAFDTDVDNDYAFELSVIAKRKPDALVIAALAPDVAKVMKAARKIKALRKVVFVGGNSFNTPGLLKKAGSAAEGAISGAAYLPSLKTPGNAAFVAAYKAKFGAAPDQFAAQAYAGVQILASAIGAAGTLDRLKIRDALAAVKGLPTVLGTFSFDANRNPVLAPVTVVARKGAFVRL